MFEKLPIFEAFDRGASFAEMADVLKRMPFSITGRYAMTLRNRLMIRGFPEGVDFVEVKLASAAANCGPDGAPKDDVSDVLRMAGRALDEAAAARDAAHSAALAAEGGGM